MEKVDVLTEKDKKRRTTVVSVVAAVLIVVFVITAFAVDAYKREEYVEEETIIGTHIKGAVKNSGYYEIPLGTRVREAVEIAGGFDENAFVDGINLASYVKDGEEIVVPYKGLFENGALNLNTVTKEELCELVDGIGEDRAKKIIDYRDEHNGFVSVLELNDILGKNKAKDLYDKFYVG